jgi:hypothetical protein
VKPAFDRCGKGKRHEALCISGKPRHIGGETKTSNEFFL